MASHCSSVSLSFFLVLLSVIIIPSHTQQNPRLSKAYTALQAWKRLITSDPNGFTSNWNNLQVCNYTGVYCTPFPDDPSTITVAGIDLNGAHIAGSLPEDLGLLTDLAVLHISSNRFSGSLPNGLRSLTLLFELDVSNNQLSGPFPEVVLDLPSLKFLDLRFNAFHGDVPSRLFDLKLDAIFLNDNAFQFALPENLGNSPVSVLVLANNDIKGCIPSSVAKMKDTLNEIVISKTGLRGCLGEGIGELVNVTVFDLSFNGFVGALPEAVGGMKSLEVLNVEHNMFSGEVPATVCTLPRLRKFPRRFNCFSGESKECKGLREMDGRTSYLLERPEQLSCNNARGVDCRAFKCL